MLLNLLACSVFADGSLEPKDYTFVILSPHREYYAVQVLQKWDIKDDTNQVGRTYIAKTGLFEVCRTIDGERIWQTNTVLGVHGDLFLSDDPDYIVELADRLPSCGLTGLHGSMVAEAPLEKQNQILNQEAICFYKKGQLLASHSLRDLDFRAGTLELSVSHIFFFTSCAAEILGHWEYPINDLAKSTNPRFDKTNHTFSFIGKDLRERVLDYTTGRVISIQTQATADEHISELRSRLQSEEESQSTNAPTKKSTVP